MARLLKNALVWLRDNPSDCLLVHTAVVNFAPLLLAPKMWTNTHMCSILLPNCIIIFCRFDICIDLFSRKKKYSMYINDAAKLSHTYIFWYKVNVYLKISPK